MYAHSSGGYQRPARPLYFACSRSASTLLSNRGAGGGSFFPLPEPPLPDPDPPLPRPPDPPLPRTPEPPVLVASVAVASVVDADSAIAGSAAGTCATFGFGGGAL